jgi:hypothetical protein
LDQAGAYPTGKSGITKVEEFEMVMSGFQMENEKSKSGAMTGIRGIDSRRMQERGHGSVGAFFSQMPYDGLHGQSSPFLYGNIFVLYQSIHVDYSLRFSR